VTHTETRKIGTVSKTEWHFGPEDLVKTKFIVIVLKRAWAGLLKLFENFKIASLETELQLPNLLLKSQNYSALNWS
jgi:hypothetical protein